MSNPVIVNIPDPEPEPESHSEDVAAVEAAADRAEDAAEEVRSETNHAEQAAIDSSAAAAEATQRADDSEEAAATSAQAAEVSVGALEKIQETLDTLGERLAKALEKPTMPESLEEVDDPASPVIPEDATPEPIKSDDKPRRTHPWYRKWGQRD